MSARIELMQGATLFHGRSEDGVFLVVVIELGDGVSVLARISFS